MTNLKEAIAAGALAVAFAVPAQADVIIDTGLGDIPARLLTKSRTTDVSGAFLVEVPTLATGSWTLDSLDMPIVASNLSGAGFSATFSSAVWEEVPPATPDDLTSYNVTRLGDPLAYQEFRPANGASTLHFVLAGIPVHSGDVFLFDLNPLPGSVGLRTLNGWAIDGTDGTMKALVRDNNLGVEEGRLIPTLSYSLSATRDVLPAVPEPETYAMFVAGLGLLGAAARRRKTAA